MGQGLRVPFGTGGTSILFAPLVGGYRGHGPCSPNPSLKLRTHDFPNDSSNSEYASPFLFLECRGSLFQQYIGYSNAGLLFMDDRNMAVS